MANDIKRLLAYELHKPARRNFIRRAVISRGFDDLWQADLVDMTPYAAENNNIKFMLTIIDTYSKYAWAVPIQTKSASHVTSAMSRVFDASHRIPRNLHTDDGKEFFNRDFKKLMQTHNINHYSTYSHLKASIVERWNRTLKTKMWREFSYRGSHKWLDILDGLVNTYNNTKHCTIQMKPADVSRATQIAAYKNNTNFKRLIRPAVFRVGDQVRISKYKHVFEKGYTPNWTTEVFKIVEVKHTMPVTYALEDFEGIRIKGGFYQEELQKTRFPDSYLVEKVLKRRKNKYFVKWLGFDEKHNSWISKADFM